MDFSTEGELFEKSFLLILSVLCKPINFDLSAREEYPVYPVFLVELLL